jgi:AbrB family looped-hinge helix DNA binding protein
MHTTMTIKGQITLPKPIRESLGLQPGDRIEFAAAEGGFLLRRQVNRGAIDKWRGFLTHLKGKRSDDIVGSMRGKDR